MDVDDGDLIRDGLRDIANGVESIPALLVLTAAPRLLLLAMPDASRARYQSDFRNAQQLVDAGFVDVRRLRELYDAIEPELSRYTAIHPPSFRAKVEEFIARH